MEQIKIVGLDISEVSAWSANQERQSNSRNSWYRPREANVWSCKGFLDA